MNKTALKKSTATKYTVYFPFKKKDDEKLVAEIRTKVLDFVKKVFGGATVYTAQGATDTWGEETTYVLEILVENEENKETMIEQLTWLILSYLDNLQSSGFKDPNGKGREKTVWFYEHSVTLYKLDNPDLAKPSDGGSK